MSFAGTVSAMITSLKNNSRKRKTLYNKKYIYRKTGKNKLKFPDIKATSEQLESIRKMVIRENRYLILKRVIALLIALVISIGIIYLIITYLDQVIFSPTF